MPTHPLQILILLALGSTQFAATAVAQTVWQVPAAASIDAAIAAAAPGDILVLAAGGVYSPFALTKGLTIRGNNATLEAGSGGVPLRVQVPAGQFAVVEALRCILGTSPVAQFGCRAEVQSGSVQFEDCEFRFARGPALTIAGGNAILDRCTVAAYTVSGSGLSLLNAPGLVVGGGALTLRDSTVTGAPSVCAQPSCAFGSLAGRPGLVLQAGTARLERCSISAGGNSGVGLLSPGAGVEVVAGSLQAANCTLTGGSYAFNVGGPGLVNLGSTTVELRQTQLVPGAGAPASTGSVAAAAPLLRLALAPAWNRGQDSVLTTTGVPGEPYVLLLAPDSAPSPVPPVVEPLWALGGAVAHLGVLAATGADALTVSVPNQPALQHARVACQAIAGLQLPLRASTVAGGVIR